MKPSYLIRGTPGHPLHPPLTDVTIGAYTVALVLGILGALGVSEGNVSKAWWLALLVGVISSAATAATGFADWVQITRGTPLWRTATSHMVANLAASVFFILAVVLGHGGYVEGEVTGRGLVLTIIGFALLTVGGWIGGSITYVHGMRVLEMPEEPTHRAVAPVTPEKEAAGS